MDVGGLEVFEGVVLEVGEEGAERCGGRGGRGRGAEELRGAEDALEEAAGSGLDVAFDSRELAGEAEVGVCAEAEVGVQEAGGVEVGVSVGGAVAEEDCLLEAGDGAEDAALLRVEEAGLEADEVVGCGLAVFGAELDYGEGAAAGAGVCEADGLHGAEGWGHGALAGDLFYGLAAGEEAGVIVWEV